jgi:hypothetical protein
MDKFELKQNLKKTNKIIEFALKEKLSKPYQVDFEVGDTDYDDNGLISILYVLNISFSDPDSHLEIDEITSELTKQSDTIYNLITNKKSSIGPDGLFGPYRENNAYLSPSVRGIEYNVDIFKTSWIFEIIIN